MSEAWSAAKSVPISDSFPSRAWHAAQRIAATWRAENSAGSSRASDERSVAANASRASRCSFDSPKSGAFLRVAGSAAMQPRFQLAAGIAARSGAFSEVVSFSSTWQFKHPEERTSCCPDASSPAGLSGTFPCALVMRNAARLSASSPESLKLGIGFHA